MPCGPAVRVKQIVENNKVKASQKIGVKEHFVFVGETKRHFWPKLGLHVVISSKLDGETGLVLDMLVLQSGRHGLWGFS